MRKIEEMKSKSYFAYLLRMWQAGRPEQPEWHASVEEPHTHAVTGFDNLPALFQYLQSLSEQADNEEANPPNPTHKEK